MTSISPPSISSSSFPRSSSSAAAFHPQLPCQLASPHMPNSASCHRTIRISCSRKPFTVAAGAGGALMSNSVQPRNGVYTVGEFMTRKEDLHVVKPSTSADEALEALVANRITGFPVVDDDWKLVGVVSDYDLLALDSISGTGRSDTDIFPEVDNSWTTFNDLQMLLNKTNGKVIGDLMTPAPLAVRESTNLEDTARLLLRTKYRRLPVVDSEGRLVGIITRGNVVRAALQIKRSLEMQS